MASNHTTPECSLSNDGAYAVIEDNSNLFAQTPEGSSAFDEVSIQSGTSTGPVALPAGQQAVPIAAYGSVIYVLWTTQMGETLPDGSFTSINEWGTSIERVNLATGQLEYPLALPAEAWPPPGGF